MCPGEKGPDLGFRQLLGDRGPDDRRKFSVGPIGDAPGHFWRQGKAPFDISVFGIFFLSQDQTPSFKHRGQRMVNPCLPPRRFSILQPDAFAACSSSCTPHFPHT